MAYSPEHIIIDPAIESTSFACDLHACKGACCTLPGGRGAPLLDEEILHIAQALPIVLTSLPPDHQHALAESGAFEGSPGDYHTTCINHGPCVFVTYDEGIAHCSIEQAFHRGELAWRKPLSCHLFPIRIDAGTPVSARFEYIPECRPALHRGTVEDVPLVSFVSEALERAFGVSWSSLRERTTR